VEPAAAALALVDAADAPPSPLDEAAAGAPPAPLDEADPVVALAGSGEEEQEAARAIPTIESAHGKSR
jgi:hypothetical protein